MPEWEYIRFMSRNYLQVSCPWKNSEESFQYRMLLSEPIKGLLPCKEREMNGINYLLYDISSMQNLRSLYAEKKMDFTAFYQLIFSLRRALGNMQAYLLEAESLLLWPEFVFLELDTKEILFLYYPFTDHYEDGWKEFYQFLLSVIDHEDDDLTDIVYQMYEKVENLSGYAWVDEIYHKLGQLQENRNIGVWEEEHAEATANKQEADDILNCSPSMSDVDSMLFEREGFHKDPEEPQKPDRQTVHKCGKALLTCILYASAVGALVYYLYAEYILSAVENAILWGGLTAFTGVAAFLLYQWLQRTGIQEERESAKSEKYEMPENNVGFSGQIMEESVEDSYGKTIYIEADEIENKLYGIGKKNRKNIEMQKFPFIIGKKEDAVDAVLEDTSVSRMHARFFWQDQKLYLEDLNSTNGTYKNGMMLAPHEKVEVLPEDEIRFGKLSFLYR